MWESHCKLDQGEERGKLFGCSCKNELHSTEFAHFFDTFSLDSQIRQPLVAIFLALWVDVNGSYNWNEKNLREEKIIWLL